MNVCVCTVKKKLENIAEGIDVEREGGGEVQSDSSDEVIGPPLPPGFKVNNLTDREREGEREQEKVGERVDEKVELLSLPC